MTQDEFKKITAELEPNDVLILSILYGIIPSPHPLITAESLRHAVITGLYKKVNEDFEFNVIHSFENDILCIN